MKRNKNNVLITFWDNQGRWLILLIMGSVLGAFFAIMKRNYEPLFFSLYHFINTEMTEGKGLNLLKDTISVYGIQLGGIWLCGLFPVTRYLGILIFIMTSFSYSFTVTSIVLLYGLKGVLVALMTCSIQMCVVLFMMIYIGSRSCIGDKKNRGIGKVSYYYLMGHIVAVAMGLGVVNVYLQPYIEKVMMKMIG